MHAIPVRPEVAITHAPSEIIVPAKTVARRVQLKYSTAGSQGFGPVGAGSARRDRDDGVGPNSTMNFAICSRALLEMARQGDFWT